jgi:hypothetical protein
MKVLARIFEKSKKVVKLHSKHGQLKSSGDGDPKSQMLDDKEPRESFLPFRIRGKKAKS